MNMISDFFGFVEVEPHVVPCVPLDVTSPHHRLSCRIARMLRLKTIVPVCFALLLAACGGGGHLSVGFPGEGENEPPEGGEPLKLDFPPRSTKRYKLPFRISGGIPPYESSLDGCPDWVTLFPDQAVLAGTAPSQDRGKTFFCTYRVTESDPGFRPARSVSYGLRLMVGSPETTLTFDGAVRPVNLVVGTFRDQELPEASDGVEPYTYSFTCAGGSLPSGMGFAPATRRFAGTPEAPFHDSCTYTVTDSSQPAETASQAVEVEVTSTTLTFRDDVPDEVNLRVGDFDDRELPQASGGVEPYTYSFTCAGGMLPSGMGFAPATRIFAGTPDAPFRDSCTYTVTDNAETPETLSRAVEVEVHGLVIPPLTLPPPDKIELSVGEFHGDGDPLPAASGGVQPYTYAFTCSGGSLPSGMGFAPATRIFAGTPDAPFRDSCTYTVTDSSQPAETASQAVEVEVTSTTLTFRDDVPDEVNLRVGDFDDRELPQASGGVEPYTYSFTCAGGMLPSGMGFAPETRIFAGTPDAPFHDSCAYTVTDSSQPAETFSQAVEVEVTSAETQPLALRSEPPQASFIIGEFRPYPLPEATGGVEPYTYTFTCEGGSLPPGIGFSPATRVLAGVADAVFHASCTYTVTDSSQPAATFSRNVVVSAQTLALPSVPDQPFVIGTFRSVRLPAATGGVSPYTYDLTCASGGLPPGVGFASATRVLAGVTDTVFDDSCTYTVTDSAQPAATFSRDIEVTSATAGFLDLPDTPEKVRFVIGDFRSFTLPPATGGVAPYTYTFCDGGSLPSGVRFTPANRVLAGVTDTVFDDSCTYTVTDSAQPAATFSRDIEVTSESFDLPDTPEEVRFVIGTFRSVTLPAATGGVAPYTYTFCDGGSLPSRVGFAPATRRLAGIADAAFDDSCTYEVTDSAGAMVSRVIKVTVESLALPDTPEEVRFVIGTFRSVTLPAATGGVGPYRYDFNCEGGSLPSRVGFAPATRRLAGIADAVFDNSCTYTVTDSAQPAAMVSRDIKVTSELLGLRVASAQARQAFVIGTFRSVTLPAATGGVEPYTYDFTCAGGRLPPGVGFTPATRVLAGVANAVFRDSCTYTVTDSARPAATTFSQDIVVTSAAAGALELTRVFKDISNDELEPLKIGRRSRTVFQEASGGVAPYTYELADCTLPTGLEFHPNTRILSGTPNEEYRGPNCTYRVTDSSTPPMSVSLSFVLTVEPLEVNAWRFRTRTVDPGGPCVVPGAGSVEVATLPAAHAGNGPAVYAVPGAPYPAVTGSFLSFKPDTRVLTYANPAPPPVVGTPNTYRYLVGTAAGVDPMNAEDALCLDVQYDSNDVNMVCPDNTYIHVHLRVRDDAFWDENAKEYRCPDTIAPSPRSNAQGSPSNPVHEALGPVHARRALDVAHGAVLDRVRGWTPGESPGDAQVLSAIAPTVGIGSLSGRSEGFDYSGSSESLSTGAELGAGTWQAGVVGSFTRTELDYRADASLAEHGYVAGEHDTEVLSLHPFAAWHTPSGGHVWASLGAGTGELRHRDDPGFPSWSRSDVHLRTWAAGASVPVADILAGDLQAEGGIESFSFDIDGGGRISSSLPTLRGRDWRAGLAWSAPVPSAPSVAVAYRRLTGDGPEGGRLETRGSVSVQGIFDPRLALLANAEGAFGLGDYEHDFWGLTGGVRFAPDGTRRGFGLELDTRFESLEEDDSAGVGIRAEAGYGLWGGSWFGTLRPHVGLIRHPGGSFLRRSVGVDLRDTPNTRAKVEVHDHPHHRSPALRFSLHQRF